MKTACALGLGVLLLGLSARGDDDCGGSSGTARWIAAMAPVALQAQDGEAGVSSTNEPPRAVKSSAATDEGAHGAVAFEYRRAIGDEFDSMAVAKLSFEVLETKHTGFGLFLLAGDVEFKDGSRTDQAAYDAFVLGWGGGLRLYLTPAKTLLRPYVTGDMSWLWVHWRYRDEVVSGGERVRSDFKQAIDGYAGVGLLIGSNKRVNLFGEIGVGGVVFVGTTGNEVNSDLFDSFGYVGAKVGLRLSL